MSEKIYVPRATCKETTFRDGGTLLKVGFHVDTLVEFVKKHANEKGFVNFVISRRKEVGKYGETHSLAVDTWTPGGGSGGSGRSADAPSGQQTAAQRLMAERKAGGGPAKAAPAPAADEDGDSLPF